MGTQCSTCGSSASRDGDNMKRKVGKVSRKKKGEVQIQPPQRKFAPEQGMAAGGEGNIQNL